MPIYVAKYAGYCFGVKRAVDRVHTLIEENRGGTKICTLGELIHNTRFVRELAAKGASVIEEDELESLAQAAGDLLATCLAVDAYTYYYTRDGRQRAQLRPTSSPQEPSSEQGPAGFQSQIVKSSSRACAPARSSPSSA